METAFCRCTGRAASEFGAGVIFAMRAVEFTKRRACLSLGASVRRLIFERSGVRAMVYFLKFGLRAAQIYARGNCSMFKFAAPQTYDFANASGLARKSVSRG